jgi:deoxyribonuclease IV
VKPFDRLLFGTAGTPNSSKSSDTITGIKRLKELGLDALEIEYVRGTFPRKETAQAISSAAHENNIRITAHGPYFINLNAETEDKRKASRDRILKTAYFGSLSGAESFTFHAGFFLGHDPNTVYDHMKKELASIVSEIRTRKIEIDMRPELTGKEKQFGSLDELLRLSQDVDGIQPCIDWSHLHARNGGYNTKKDFKSVLDSIHQSLGQYALTNLHMHISGIEYSVKGERKHLNLDESDFNYKELLRVLKEYDVRGILICESPSLEDDALLLQRVYESV